MKVSELIETLRNLPQDAQVWHLWDGEARTRIQCVWLARNGRVITADHHEVCYSEKTRPESAPTEEQDRCWRTPDNPKPYDEDDWDEEA